MDEQRREQVRRAAAELSTWGAVAVVGAGASRGLGFPMTDQLHALIWHALDADTVARDTLALKLGRAPALAKELVGDDVERVRAALEAITASERARHEYQHGFARLNEERNRHSSPAHDALAELLHRGAIAAVVSLNWDTLLETAYQRQYGARLVPGGPILYKPHGDAAHPDIPWMLPHEAGHIPVALEAHMARLVAERPRSLLVVGYSERDEEVVRKLTGPLAGRWRVIRISPSARGDLAIALGAEEALPALLRTAYPSEELPGWEYVHFDRQHDPGPLLLGRRLGPRDVVACPRLPELADVGRQLAVGHSALIVAEPGHGKSITSYQAAHDLARDGYEVVQPALTGRVTPEMIGALDQLRRPTVVVVDDAHLTDERILRQLLDAASADRAVIAASTVGQAGNENGRQGEQIRLSGPRAVEVIARHFGERRDAILGHLRQLDDRIGDRSFDEPFERRLAEAAKATTPWQFSFVLTAGWRRAESTMATLRENERADLLLAAVALGQYLSLDAGVTRAWLLEAATVLGRDEDWLDRKLQTLRDRRLIIGDRALRCPHIRFAEVILQMVCADPRDLEWANLVELLRFGLLRQDFPLRGSEWLLFSIWYADAFRGWSSQQISVVNEQVLEALTERCWQVSTREGRRDASYLLRTLLRWRPTLAESILARSALLGSWIELADGYSSWGLRWLLNDLSHESRHVAEAICNKADPAGVAEALQRASRADAGAWGELLQTLGAVAPEPWQQQLRTSLDENTLYALVRDLHTSELWAFEELWQGAWALDVELGLRVVQEAVPSLTAAINADPVRALDYLSFSTLAILPLYVQALRRQTALPLPLRQVYLQFAAALDPRAIARAIPEGKPRNWERFDSLLVGLKHGAPRVAEAIGSLVDLDALDRATAGMWADVPHDLVTLIRALDITDEHEPSRSWLRRHEHDLGKPWTDAARIVPEICARLVRDGQTFDLNVSVGSRWGDAREALLAIAAHDRSAACAVIAANYKTISDGIAHPQLADHEELLELLDSIAELMPTGLRQIVDLLDPSDVGEKWAALLRAKGARKKLAGRLIDVAASLPGPIGEVAVRLSRRFHRAHQA